MIPKLEETSYTLKPKFISGLTIGLSNNCFFINDKQIIYLAARVIVVHDIQDNSQRFIYLNEPDKTISTMELSNSKNLLAVVEHGNERKATISIYDLEKSIHLQRLTIPLKMESDLMKIQFSYDDVYLAALSDGPDFTMYYFNWQQSKIENRVQVIKPPLIPGPVYDMAINPGTNDKIVFVGNELFRAMKISQTIWRQYGYNHANKSKFTSVCWLNNIRILACTTDGQLFIVEFGNLIATYHIQNLNHFDTRVITQESQNFGLTDRDTHIKACMTIKSGFMVIVNGYWIYYYKLISNNKYVKSNVFQVPQDNNLEETSSKNIEYYGINTITVNPKNKIMFCVTKRRQLYWTMIEGKPMNSKVDVFGEHIHQGGVSGLSICIWKPLFMTCCMIDRIVKVWNYETRLTILTKKFNEDVLGVAMHPTGHYAVVSMISRALFVVIRNKELMERKTFDVAGCDMFKFSMSGHMIAFVINNVQIHIYCATSFEKRFELKGHKGKITDFVWAENDWKVYSCDVDGRMCRFDLFAGKHVLDIIFRNKILNGVAVSSDSKQIYTASQDGEIREMYNRMTIRNKHLEHGPIKSILLSRSDTILLVTCQYGEILSVALPIKSKIKYKEYAVHSKPILSISLTVDNLKLITCSEDGTICMWDVDYPKEKIATNMHSMNRFVDETLVSIKYLESCASRVAELNARSKLLSKEIANASIDEDKINKKRDVVDYYNMLLMRLESQHQDMVNTYETDMKNIKIQIDKLSNEHIENYKMLKEINNEQLSIADDKCVIIEEQIIRTDVKKIIKVELLLAIHIRVIQKLRNTYNTDMNKLIHLNNECINNFDEKKRTIRQIEEVSAQGKREIIELDIHYVHKYEKLMKTISKAKEEVNIYKTKVTSIIKEEMDLRSLVSMNYGNINECITREKTLNEKLLDCKSYMARCNAVIRAKDNEMDDMMSEIKIMKRQIIVLRCNHEERSAFVLPLKDELNRMLLTIESMTEISIDLNKDVQLLNMETSQLQITIQRTSAVIKKLKEFIVVQDGFIKNLTLEIHFAYKKTNDKVELKKIISEMSKHKISGNFSKGLNTDLFKQRHILETHHKDLERRSKLQESLTPIHHKVIKQNIILINEVNRLKKRVANNQSKYNELLCLLGWENLKEFSINSNPVMENKIGTQDLSQDEKEIAIVNF